MVWYFYTFVDNKRNFHYLCITLKYNIMVKFKIGETVFMKCDDEKRRFMVTGILTRRRYREYEITGIDAMFYKQEFELCSEIKQKQVPGFKTIKTK